MAATANQGAKVTLYWLDGSRAHRILWLLEELKIPYDVKVFHRTKERLAPPELKQVHPLGKSPVISITREGQKDLVLAESGLIIEYLIDHWGPQLKPKRYPDGQDGQIAAENAAYLHDRWFMHAAEGSLMPLMVFKIITTGMRSRVVPFLARPITSFIAGKIDSMAVHPRIQEQLEYIEELAKSAPNGGPYLCGSSLSGSDFMMSYPIQGAQFADLLPKTRYPRLSAWITQIESLPSYKAAVEKTKELDGGKFGLFPEV